MNKYNRLLPQFKINSQFKLISRHSNIFIVNDLTYLNTLRLHLILAQDCTHLIEFVFQGNVSKNCLRAPPNDRRSDSFGPTPTIFGANHSTKERYKIGNKKNWYHRGQAEEQNTRRVFLLTRFLNTFCRHNPVTTTGRLAGERGEDQNWSPSQDGNESKTNYCC
jgi:hypothetical protein